MICRRSPSSAVCHSGSTGIGGADAPCSTQPRRDPQRAPSGSRGPRLPPRQYIIADGVDGVHAGDADSRCSRVTDGASGALSSDTEETCAAALPPAGANARVAAPLPPIDAPPATRAELLARLRMTSCAPVGATGRLPAAGGRDAARCPPASANYEPRGSADQLAYRRGELPSARPMHVDAGWADCDLATVASARLAVTPLYSAAADVSSAASGASAAGVVTGASDIVADGATVAAVTGPHPVPRFATAEVGRGCTDPVEVAAATMPVRRRLVGKQRVTMSSAANSSKIATDRMRNTTSPTRDSDAPMGLPPE